MTTVFAAVSCILAAQASELITFDLIKYQSPTDWKADKSSSVHSYSTGDLESGYSQIVVYAAIPASADPKKNFDTSWETLLKESLGATEKPLINGPGQVGASTVYSGTTTFELEKKPFTAILTTYTLGEKMQNILVVTTTEKHLKALSSFVDSISLVDQNPTPATPTSGTDKPIGKNTPKIENYRVPTLYMRVYKDTTIYKSYGWLAIYSNGDMLPNFPDTGFHGFDKPLYKESWGKWSKSGKVVTVEAERWGKQQLDILSDKQWRIKNSNILSYYRVQPVNGLKLDGNYSADKLGWHRNQPNLYAKPTYIAFRKDGTFTDFGCYHTTTVDAPQSGKYSIKDFSLILKYSDGTEVQRAFCGIGSEDPIKYTGTYIIGGFAWFLEAQ